MKTNFSFIHSFFYSIPKNKQMDEFDIAFQNCIDLLADTYTLQEDILQDTCQEEETSIFIFDKNKLDEYYLQCAKTNAYISFAALMSIECYSTTKKTNIWSWASSEFDRFVDIFDMLLRNGRSGFAIYMFNALFDNQRRISRLFFVKLKNKEYSCHTKYFRMLTIVRKAGRANPTLRAIMINPNKAFLH